MTPEEKLLIDRYIENSLTGGELKNFLDKIESNESFKKEVSFQNILIEGIQFSEYQRQMALVKGAIAFKKSFIPFGLKMIFTFLIITLAGIALWNYVDPGSTGKKHNYFSLDFFRKQKNDSINASISESNISKNKKVTLRPLLITDSVIAKEEPVIRMDSLLQADTSEIVVKKDQMLISIVLKTIDYEAQNIKQENPEASITNSTVDKLNPSAGLPDAKESKDDFYVVEFWVSPINYKGYKLVNEKLILFGIEEPDAVQLFTRKNRLWMKYGQDYFELTPTEDFESLSKSNEIPSALK